MRTAILGLLLGSSLPAQTFVVDAGSGPGSNFTSIATAVATVPSGSTLLVRPGHYAGFLVQSKSLTVLGEPGVVIDQPNSANAGVDIAHLAPHQSVTLRGLRLTCCPGSITVRSCQGPVLLEDDITATNHCNPPSYGVPSILLSHSDRVTVRSCSGHSASSTQSSAVFESCTLVGSAAVYLAPGFTLPSTPGLVVQGGAVQLVDCTLTGGAGNPSVTVGGQNRPGLEIAGGSVRVLAPGQVTAGSTFLGPQAFAIGGSGSLRIDTAVALSAPAIDPAIVTHALPMPSVLGQSAGLGGVLAADALGPVGSTVILVVGLPGAAVQLPGIADPFWIDPAAYAFLAVGVPQPGVPVRGTVSVPNHPGLLGVRIAWQSAALTPTGFMASNPTQTLVR